MEEIWDQVWPWAWPSLALAAWTVLAFWGVRRLFGWFERKVPVVDRLNDDLMASVTRYVTFALVLTGVVFWLWLTPMPPVVDDVLANDIQPWLWPSLGLVVWIVISIYAIRRVVDWLSLRAQATHTALDDALIEALGRPLSLVAIVAGINVWAGLVPFAESLAEAVSTGTKAAAVIFVVMFADGFLQAWLRERARKSRVLQTSGQVVRTAVRVVLYIIGVLMVMTSVGIDVTPVLASLGIGSLALGLALQKTLEDFLAGLLLAADQPVRVGDFVRLDSGEEGRVLHIGWRTTHIRTRDAAHVIIPNAKLAQATLINRSMPEPAMQFTCPVGVSYGSDLEMVGRVTSEVAQTVQNEHPAATEDFTPKVVFVGFGGSSIDLVVWLQARNWDAHFALKDGFIRALKARYNVENINIPFPIRTLDVPPGTSLTIEGAPSKPTKSVAKSASSTTSG